MISNCGGDGCGGGAGGTYMSNKNNNNKNSKKNSNNDGVNSRLRVVGGGDLVVVGVEREDGGVYQCVVVGVGVEWVSVGTKVVVVETKKVSGQYRFNIFSFCL